MSAVRVVRVDERGPFVRCDGHVFRPGSPGGYAPRRSIRYSAGDRVAARHIPGSARARVGAEVWHLDPDT